MTYIGNFILHDLMGVYCTSIWLQDTKCKSLLYFGNRENETQTLESFRTVVAKKKVTVLFSSIVDASTNLQM